MSYEHSMSIPHMAVSAYVTRRSKLESRRRLFAFHFTLMPWRKAWIHLFSIPIYVKRVGQTGFFKLGLETSLGERKLNLKTCKNPLRNKSWGKFSPMKKSWLTTCMYATGVFSRGTKDLCWRLALGQSCCSLGKNFVYMYIFSTCSFILLNIFHPALRSGFAIVKQIHFYLSIPTPYHHC